VRRSQPAPRLGGYLRADPPSAIDRVARLRAKLLSDEPLTGDERRTIESWLYVIEQGRDVRQSIGIRRRRGAPRDERAWWLAFDLACRKRLMGKDAPALEAAAAHWNTPAKTVRDAFTNHRAGVGRELLEYLASSTRAAWSDEVVLKALLDLADRKLRAFPARSRNKSRE
jgi:hypothetical protein